MSFGYCILVLAIHFSLSQERCLSAVVPEAGLHCTWEQFKKHSQELNTVSMEFHEMLQNVTCKERAIRNITRILCKHRCSPRDLRINKEECLKQIYNVLHYHKSNLNQFFIKKSSNSYKIESELQDKIIDITKKISQLQQCLQNNYKFESRSSVTPISAPRTKLITEMIAWELTSATSLIARVFSPGNPSKHNNSI